MDSSDPLIDALVARLKTGLADVIAIYLFGSWGTEYVRADSDIDLAVLPSRAIPPLRRWEITQELAILARRDVDLVDLRAASTVMCFQIVAHGKRIYCAGEPACTEFEDLTFSNYVRLNEERREILKDIKDRGRIYG